MLQRRSPRRPSIRHVVAAVAGALMLSAVVTPPLHATVSVERTKRTWHPRRGITLTATHYAGPIEVRVLEFSPKPKRRGMTVEPGISGPVISSHGTPSAIGSSVGAVAAINGDFGSGGQPAHFNAVDGDIRTSGVLNGSGFAISKDEKFAWADRPDAWMSADASNHTSFRIDHWNADDRSGPGGPVGAEINAYTKEGGTLQRPDMDTCAVRLLNPTMRRWANEERTALSRTWEIGQITCQHDALPLGSEPGTVVLNSRQTGAGSDAIKALPANGTLTISWRLTGWPGVVEAIGGQPVIVDKGENVGPPQTTGSSYFYKPNPRTAIGITKGCTDADTGTQCGVIYMTVDGRNESWSTGMTLKSLGAEMLKYGAWYAINLDGGGGTAMWLNDKGPWCITDTNGGCLVNKPSDAVGERATLTAMLVLQGRDVNEPPIGDPARLSGWGAPLVDDNSRDWDLLALTDPGSTGGLLDAAAEAGTLPAGLRQDLRVYRTAVP